MTIEKFFIADPYNCEHFEMFRKFEQANNINTKTVDFFEEIKSNYSKEEYQKETNTSNDIKQSLFSTVNGEIKDSCYIQGVKDMKICSIFFADLNLNKRPLLNFAADYALNVLQMEEVFVPVAKTDKMLTQQLTSKGFENLGEEGEVVEFVRGKEALEEQKIGRII